MDGEDDEIKGVGVGASDPLDPEDELEGDQLDVDPELLDGDTEM